MARKLSRRSFLEVALAGGALGTANLTLMKDVYAQASGPIVIGHHCDLTGVISSWGLWHDKAAKAAVDIINQGGGIAGRKVELATEDTESNPASGARKLRNLVQRLNAEFIVGSVHSGVMLAAIPIASELKTIYFSTGEATEATGAKGTRFSFRTGTDTYSIAAASLPISLMVRTCVPPHACRSMPGISSSRTRPSPRGGATDMVRTSSGRASSSASVIQ